MSNVIAHLSPAAQTVLEKFRANNLGVISAYQDENTELRNALQTAKLFEQAARFGRYKINEYDVTGKLLKVSFLLNGGPKTDWGNLLGFLRKSAEEYEQESFLYKAYNANEFCDSRDFVGISTRHAVRTDVKYDYEDRIVKLVSIKTFFSRKERVW